MNRHLRALFVLSVAALLLMIAAPALAHVTVRTDNPAPEAFAKYTIRVPNESEEAATTSVEVQFPEGFTPGNYMPVPGWDITIADGVMTIEGGRIEPGQFQEFSFSAQNPVNTGDLVFPAIQTYSDGEEARWVGEPDADQPAPVVAIEGEAGEHGHGDETATEATDDAAEDAATTAPDGDAAAGIDVEPIPSDGNDTLALVALVAACLGLGLGAAAFVRSGR